MDAQANPGPAAPGAEAAPSPPAGASAGARGSPRETFLAGGVFLAAFGLRLAVWSAWKNDPLAANPLLDAADYHGWASGAAPAAAEPLLWNPLYPYLLKGVYAFLGGPRPSVALLAQAGLGALGAELAYLTARRWFRGLAPALACAALAALYAPFLVYEGLLLGAAAAAFLVWLFLFFSASADRVRIPLVWALPGAALGAAGLAEPTLLAAGVPLAAWLALRPGEARFRRLLRPAALWIGMAASLAPAFVHNARAGVLSPLPRHGGVNFYIGNRLGATGRYERAFPGPHGMNRQRELSLAGARAASGAPVGWAEADSFWWRRGLEEACSDKAGWAALLARKALLLANAYEVPLDYNVEFLRSRMPLLAGPFPSFALVFPLAAAGLAFLARDRKVPWAAVLLLAGGGASVALFFVASRYRLPLAPPLLLLAGYGAVESVRSLASARLVGLVSAAAAAAAAAFVAFLPVERSDFSGSWRMVGDAQSKQGAFYDALGSYDRSLALRPTSPAYNNRGTALLKLSKTGEAALSFRKAIELEPSNREAWNNMGVALKKAGDLFEAEEVFLETLRRFPDYATPAQNLVRLYEEQGMSDQARAVREAFLGGR